MATLIPARLDQPIRAGVKPKLSTFSLHELKTILGCQHIEILRLPRNSIMGAAFLVTDEEGKLKEHIRNARASAIMQFPTVAQFRASVARMETGVLILGEPPATANPDEPCDYIAGDALACFANELD